MNTIDIALRIATTAHAGQLNRDGYPAILHPLSVGLMGHTDEEKMTGFLHEVVERSHYTFDDLLHEGIPTGVVNALRLLTHEERVSCEEHLRRIIHSGNPIALQVEHNDLQQHYEREKAHPDQQAKYGEALAKVREAIKACSKVDLYQPPTDPHIAVGIFACGCFWGTQHQFQKQKGVVGTLAGYTGGTEAFPSYADVRDHKTHHVEAVIVEFIPRWCPMRVSANCSSRYTTPHRPMAWDPTWAPNTAVAYSIAMRPKGRRPSA